MRIQIYPDGVITIDTDPPNDAEPERDSQLDAMTENAAPTLPFGFQPSPTRTYEED